jgi:hypothetical protein
MKAKEPLNWSRRRPFVTALLWALVPSFAAFWIGRTFSDQHLKTAVFTGAATLLFGGLLGGVLKVLLDDIVAAKRRREDAADFVANVLADLKGVYDRVGRAGTLIPAHKSVKTYGDEMRDMIEARVQLRNITRALERRAEGVSEAVRKAVTFHVNQMKQYLDELTGEFRDHYKALSDKQRGYEERTKVMLKRYADESSEEQPPQLPGFVWDSLSRLPMLEDFIAWGQKYTRGFEEPLDAASALLRNEHARILQGRGGMGTSSM